MAMLASPQQGTGSNAPQGVSSSLATSENPSTPVVDSNNYYSAITLSDVTTVYGAPI